MENDAVAPAVMPEATPSTTPEPAAPAPAPALTSAQVAEYLGTTPEMLDQYQKFYSNNGGFDKTFANMKKALTTRQADMPQPQVQAPAPSPVNDFPQQPQPAAQPQRFTGGISQEEFAIQQYFESLAGQEQYANIADQIRSGAILKEMAKFDITPMIDGRFNSQKITDFLNMYSKTVPAVPTETPVTTTPTVDYVQVGETINSMDAAMRVLKQDQELRALGQAGHPMAAEANKFFDQVLNTNQNRGRVEHTTLAEAKKK